MFLSCEMRIMSSIVTVKQEKKKKFNNPIESEMSFIGIFESYAIF